MEQFVGTTQTHRDRFMPQMFNGVFQSFLPMSLFCCFCGLGLCVCGTFHRFRTLMRCQGLQGKQDTTHAKPQKFQDLVFWGYESL